MIVRAHVLVNKMNAATKRIAVRTVFRKMNMRESFLRKKKVFDYVQHSTHPVRS